MTIHNLEGAKEVEKLGFSRAVLSRELSLDEVRFIKENSNIEIETFIHGALCISYSGQCLFSSMVGGRSGNRGKCAQACRLPYELLKNNKSIDKGFLLSPRDLCGLEVLPDLINSGVDCIKIEGRMKSPEYVATVTRIYRKYIDLYYKLENKSDYKIEEEDKKDLLQVFNRGGFSNGHYNRKPNKDLIYKDKPNNMGIYIGNVSSFNSNKGHVKLHLNDSISIGDTISFEKEAGTYTISELMKDNKNITSANCKDFVEIGRMKGNISCGDKIFKISSKALSAIAYQTFSGKDFKKINLKASITIKQNSPIILTIEPKIQSFYNKKIQVQVTSDCIPSLAIKHPITKERIEKQLSKTSNTPFYFEEITVNLENGLYISPISALNELRRIALAKLESEIIADYKYNRNLSAPHINKNSQLFSTENYVKPGISLLLNLLDEKTDYSTLENIEKLYLPISHFQNPKYNTIVDYLSHRFKTYIYLPTIIKSNYRNIIENEIYRITKHYPIKGFVISNLGQIELLKNFIKDYEFIGNYTLNIFNSYTATTLNSLGISTITLSPELNYNELLEVTSSLNTSSELIVYGNLPVMTSKYCLLGKSNKCYPECSQYCKNKDKYYLKDRLGFTFYILPDKMQTITTIFNSKTTSIPFSDFNLNYVRIDILTESIDEINKIINTVKLEKRLEGRNYTSGNLNRKV